MRALQILAVATACTTFPLWGIPVVYTDRNTFLAAVAPGYYEEPFNTPQGETGLLTFQSANFVFTATPILGRSVAVGPQPGQAAGGFLFGGGAASDMELSGLSNLPLDNSVRLAFGGYFFIVDENGAIVPNQAGVLDFIWANGNTLTVELNAPTSPTGFYGFIDTAGNSANSLRNAYIDFRRVESQFVRASGYVAVDQVIFGAAATPVPEPHPAWLTAAGALALLLARRYVFLQSPRKPGIG